MPGPGPRNPVPDRTGRPARPVDLVVVGHVGLATIRTSANEQTSPGGSGYAVAAAAAALIGSRVGLVAQVGQDFKRSWLRDLGADLDGVEELPGASPRLRIVQLADGSRSFRGDLGVAATVRVGSFPPAYLNATHIHLGTAPPEQQLTWLHFLRGQRCPAHISADMFEHYVAEEPEACRAVCDNVNLLFMNEVEYDGLYGRGQRPVPKAPLILKSGPAGASILIDGMPHDADAPNARPPQVRVMDPTGGGEILAGVFLALCASGLERMLALGYAVRAAAACVEEFGVNGPRLRAALAHIRDEARTRSGEQPLAGL